MDVHALNGIEEEKLTSIVEDAKDYAISKGVAMRSFDLPKDGRIPLPFCIVPSVFPKEMFELACSLQPHLNLILHKISHSKKFLQDCLASTIETDEFTRNIFNIFEVVESEMQDEQLSLGLIRSDYFLSGDCCGNTVGMKQVENNTIAAGFGGLSPKIREIHKYVLDRLGWKNIGCKLPVNESAHEFAKGIISAWSMYGNLYAVILFVVEEATFNICDQRALEFAVLKLESRIKILRCTFKDLRNSATLEDNKLFFKNKEVAVVYYRVGYAPEHYEHGDWKTRLLVERSAAIKCPSAGLHLAGTKKVQLHLTRLGVLEEFVTPDIAKKLRNVFANQYLLEGKEGDVAISYGIQHPEMFVLKPEREGGGNNLYGNDLKQCLESVQSTNQRKAYILMERINPPGVLNCIVRRDTIPKIGTVVCELGIFGLILGSKNNIHVNDYCGHLLRSKELHLNEGGIAAGFGALDSPYLN